MQQLIVTGANADHRRSRGARAAGAAGALAAHSIRPCAAGFIVCDEVRRIDDGSFGRAFRTLCRACSPILKRPRRGRQSGSFRGVGGRRQ